MLICYMNTVIQNYQDTTFIAIFYSPFLSNDNYLMIVIYRENGNIYYETPCLSVG